MNPVRCCSWLSALATLIAATQVSAHVEERAALRAKARTEGDVPVIVTLAMPGHHIFPEGSLRDAGAVARQRRGIADASSALSDRMLPFRAWVYRRWTSLPAVAMRVDAAALDALADDPLVSAVQEDRLSAPVLASVTHFIGSDVTASAGFGGLGQTVVIVDTGVDVGHPFLGGDGTHPSPRIVEQACFSNGPGAGTSLCPNGMSSQTGPGSADVGSGAIADVSHCDTNGANRCAHGSHVTGIAAGRDPGGQEATGYDGVAPQAGIIAIQVFTRLDDAALCEHGAPCVKSYTSDQMSALDYVNSTLIALHPEIVSVNMSLGDGMRNTTSCDGHPLKSAIEHLLSRNVATVIAAGNESYTDGVNAPGCISNAVTVASVGDGSGACQTDNIADAVSSFSNMSDQVDLLAVGECVRSAVPGDTMQSFNGTSMAAPQVTGAFAVLRAREPLLGVNEILGLLQSTGVPVTDDQRPAMPMGATTGVTKPRIALVATSSSMLGGAIRYYGNSALVPAATVELIGDDTTTVQTDTAGHYAFPTVSTGNWRIQPSKTGDTQGAVSALDAAHILQAIAGLRTLSPAQRVAADVSGNGSVSALDATRVLQYVAGLKPNLPITAQCGSDWAFIPVPAAVPDQQIVPPGIVSGSCQPGAIVFAPLAEPIDGQNFVGIVFGDVTGNWQPPCNGACPAGIVPVAVAMGIALPRPRIKVDANDNAVIVWQDHRSGTDEIYWTKLDRYGTRLIPEQSLTSNTFPATMPDHGVDSAGNVYLAFESGSTIRLAGASADGTRIWNGTTELLCSQCMSPSVVSEASGRTHIVYEHTFTGVPPFRMYYANVSFGPDGITTATATVSDRDLFGIVKAPFIDFGIDGNRYIAWRDFDATYNFGIWYGKVSGTNTVTTFGRLMHGNGVDKPVIREFRSTTANLWILFENDTGSGRQIYNATGTDQATAWSQGAGPATNPRIANLSVGTDDKLAVVWEDARDGVKRIYARVGNTHDFALSAAGDEAISPDIAAGTNGDFHVVWAQGPVGNRRIYWARLVGPTPVPPPSGSACATGSENTIMTLGCSSGTITSIDFASYGTPTGTCGGFSIGSCHASNSTSIVAAACVGRTSCSITANNATFGDPCGGTFKRLYLQAKCG